MGLMQSAGSLGRTIGPVLAGWLLAFDLGGPLQHYARTPLWTGAVLLGVTFVLTLSLLKKAPTALEPAVAPAA
jgi:MFS family permease